MSARQEELDHEDPEVDLQEEEEEEPETSVPPLEDVSEAEAMRKKVAELEEENAKIEAALNAQSQKTDAAFSSGPDVDSRSVHVSNVDYSTTCEELQAFFQACGAINRITILCDKFTGHPKGYFFSCANTHAVRFAYVEFSDVDGVANAMALNETEFKGRILKVYR